jgi:hypothetical protein
MKNITYNFSLVALWVLILGSACRASDGKLSVLNDRQLSQVRGGFCFLEICEDAPGTGVCQPYPTDDRTLCKLATCIFIDDSTLTMDIIACIGEAPDTCTEAKTYRQCVLAFKMSSCSNGPDTLYCGDHLAADCTPSKPDEACLCFVPASTRPCDWTNCSSGD